MEIMRIPASVLLTLIAATAASAAPRGTSGADGGRTLSDYNIQKESTAPPRLRIAPR